MKLPLRIRLYILATLVAGAASLAAWMWAWPDGNGLEAYGVGGWLLPITLGLLSAAAVMFPLQLDRGHKLQINDAVHFSSLLLFGAPLAVAVVGLGAGAGYLALLAMKRRNVWDAMFNPGKNALAVAAGGAAYYAIMPAHAPVLFDDLRNLLALPAAALVMYAFNTLPSCIGIALQHGKNPLRVWLNGRRVDALQSLALYLIGLVTALTVQEHAWAVVVMALPTAPIYLTLKRTVELLAQQRDNRTHTVSAVEAMADTVDARNTFTKDHSRRAAELAVRIAQAMALPEPEVEQIRMAARVLNIGKIGVPDALLRKPGRLTPDEWEQVEKHVRTGYEILGGFPDYRECRELVLQQHEHWDGSGYPEGLVGEAIALGAQIVGVADAVVAMRSERPYRKTRSHDETIEELRRQQGKQWHPAVVETAIGMLRAAEASGAQEPPAVAHAVARPVHVPA